MLYSISTIQPPYLVLYSSLVLYSQPCSNVPDKTIAEVLEERKKQNVDILIFLSFTATQHYSKEKRKQVI